MAHKFRVTTIESERGWGQRYECELFNTFEEAKTYRDSINSFNKPWVVTPDWYVVADQTIEVVEIKE